MNGRIHIDSDLNDINRFPDGSYSHLEHLLLKLGMVTETAPRISMKTISTSKTLVATKTAHNNIPNETVAPVSTDEKSISTKNVIPDSDHNPASKDTRGWAKV